MLIKAIMGEAYFDLKRKLDELGYHNSLPLDAVPLVESILADLLQTTRSLQHYMDVSKEALIQRDSLMQEFEPYKCENSKLVKENNRLHRELLHIKEDYLKLNKENTRKFKLLSEELVKKDALISKLKHDVRDLSLRGLCAGTASSRNKCRRPDTNNKICNVCICKEDKFTYNNKDLNDLKEKNNMLQEQNDSYRDEIMLLKNKVEHRDNEIIRLNIMLEGGRPSTAISKDCCSMNSENKMPDLLKKCHELESSNEILKKEIEAGLEKQHEAMLRALNLADKNKRLLEEMHKVDTLALKVEEDCNKRLAAMMTDINKLKKQTDSLTKRNIELEKQLSNQLLGAQSPNDTRLKEALDDVIKQKNILQKEIEDLVDLNKKLQDKIISLSEASTNYPQNDNVNHMSKNCLTKDELQTLLQDERRKYEDYISNIQDKLNEALNLFNTNIKVKEKTISPPLPNTFDSNYIKELQNKLCESEQKILMLKTENDELRIKTRHCEENNKQNFKDIISQLNAENSELSKENISLSQRLSNYKTLSLSANNDRGDYARRDIDRLKKEIEELTYETKLLKKDKHEYNLRYKEAMEFVDKLKRDLAFKQNEVEKLQKENSSYKLTNRTEKASAGHLKDEYNFLKEQLNKLQNDYIKEKTLASQIKNLQLETERSSSEIHKELLSLQRKLSLANDNIISLERKNNDLHSEIDTLKKDKFNLIENIKKFDQERDKMVIELDHKSEDNNILRQKLNSQTYEITRLESEISELKKQINMNKVSEHKLADNEAQLKFLNGEILRLNQKLENALIENKQLQNSLADANGALRVNKIEYEKSRKEVDSLKQQLQHYVAEIRRIEEMLSQKEAERSDMLEQFASLSVEANILENTNHSLESETASKSLQLQSYVNKIQNLETQLIDKEAILDNQSTRIATMTCKISALENEVKLLAEEKTLLEQNTLYLKQMCNSLQNENASLNKVTDDTDSEFKLYENKIKTLSNTRSTLQLEKDQIKEKLTTTEKLLSNARKEIVELKLALQDATSETKSLKDRINRLNRRETEIHETMLTKEEIDLPLMLEDTIHEVSQEDEDSLRYHELHKRSSKYSHGSTL